MGLGEFGAHNCPIVRGGLGGAKKENRAAGARLFLGDAEQSREGAQGG